MRYNQYSYDYIKKLIKIGQSKSESCENEEELSFFAYSNDFGIDELQFILMGWKNPDFVPGEIKYFYRIGEPSVDEGGCYLPSYNFAEDKPEDGISVVTTAWLHSMKSVFFNTTDENLDRKGIYKIPGFIIPSVGGDDETLICPMGWVEKNRIRTRSGLERVVRQMEKGCL